jgi:2,4-dienoyl-CoA reductase-like NADH-dependent reductase (Old Yellow Enzyme family)/thioredoxin reductase
MNMKIFDPIEIKGMILKNRIGFPPFGNMPVGEDGRVNDLTIRWYEERAKGGAGLIMTGPLRSTQPKSKKKKSKLTVFTGFGINDDSYIPGFARLAEAIHSHGAKLGAYLGAGGPVAGQGPSPLPYPDEEHAKEDSISTTMGYQMPVREVSVEEIEQIESDIAAAAVRAKAAGIDFVNIPSAHGGISLHGSFLSPFYNRRSDEYGGDWEGRLRFVMETIEKVREAVGKDYPVFVRISADEFLGKQGITLKDTTEIIVPALEKAGADCIDVSQGSLHTMEGMNIPGYYPRGCFIHLAAAVKKVANLPVIGVGNILDIDMAEKFLQEGKADIIYMGRQLTADPETPKKYVEGRAEEIRKCICCLGGCGRPCSVNYDIQDEPIPLTPTETPKTVLVIGGGIGGMEAARIAARRGHDVTLMEKNSELGGLVRALALNPLTAEFMNIVDYLAAQMRELKIDVRVCREATAADIKALNPDVIILATGAPLLLPEEVKGKAGVISHIEALKKSREIGHRVVIWGLAAAELAISLAREGKDVLLMGRGSEDTLGKNYPMMRRFWILRTLTDINAVRETSGSKRLSNLEVLFNVEVEKITPEGINIVNKDGGKRILAYDTFIVSRERVADDSLWEELRTTTAAVHKIGDCSQVGDIRKAIHSANEVARRI